MTYFHMLYSKIIEYIFLALIWTYFCFLFYNIFMKKCLDEDSFFKLKQWESKQRTTE